VEGETVSPGLLSSRAAAPATPAPAAEAVRPPPASVQATPLSVQDQV